MPLFLHLFVRCILFAVFTINRLPAYVVHDKSPYEVLFAKILDYKFLKPFDVHVFRTYPL